MRIDLRYPIVFASFYVPGLMALIGGALLGFNMDEMRPPVAIIGVMFGPIAAAGVWSQLFVDGKPMWRSLSGERNLRD